jgi:hypothetical protein
VLVAVERLEPRPRERAVATRLDRRARLAHEVEVVLQVVDGEEPWPERLAALEQVVEVATREGAAGGAAAVRVERRVGELVLAAGEPDAARGREGGALPCHGGRQHAVEHVHALADGVEEVGRGPDAHEVAGAVPRQELRRMSHHVGALGPGVPHGEAADREAVEAVIDEEARRLGAEVGVEAALHDREERLLRVRPRGEAPERPPVGPVHRLADGRGLGRRGRAHVEDHHHVGADGRLHLDRALGGEDVGSPVHVASEARALLGDDPVVGEGEDLEPARVGEDRAVPAHEAVDPADAPERLRPGAQHEVVGVREDDLGAEGAQIVGGEAGDRRARADGHERGGLDDAAGRREGSPARARPGIVERDAKGEGHLWQTGMA